MASVLHTERLVLRPVTADDHAVLLAHWTAPDVRRFLFDGAKLSAAEVTEAIENSMRDFGRAGYGPWLIYEEGAALVGTTGLRPWRTSAWRSSTAWPPVRGARGVSKNRGARGQIRDHVTGGMGCPG